MTGQRAAKRVDSIVFLALALLIAPGTTKCIHKWAEESN